MRVIGYFLLILFPMIASSQRPNIIPYVQNDKWGFVDSMKNIIVMPKYEYVSRMVDGYATVYMKGTEYGQVAGLINSKGKETIPPEWDVYFESSSNYAWLYKDYKQFIVSRDGRIIPPKNSGYEFDGFFLNGYAKVKQNGKYGFADSIGKIIIPCMFESISKNITEGFVAVKQEGKWGFIDKHGNQVTAPKYDAVYPFNNGRARVELQGRGMGFIDSKGEELMPILFSDATDYSEGYAWAVKGNHILLLNTQGKTVYETTDKLYVKFKEGHAILYGDDEIIIVNKEGHHIKRKGNYFEVEPFSDGLARVRDGNFMYGFIDYTGKEVITPSFDDVGSFKNGRANFSSGGKNGYIDKSGKVAIPAVYDQAFGFEMDWLK